MVMGSAPLPVIVHDTSDAFTRREHSKPKPFSSQRHNFLSPNLKDMYEKPIRGASTDHLDPKDDEMDIEKLLKDIEYLGSSNMSWKERKKLENQKVVSLGGKPPNNRRTPLSMAKATMKKQKKREEKMLQEELIIGRFRKRGNNSNKVEKRKTEDRVLKASEGRFRNGILNVKHLLGAASSSTKDDNMRKVSNGNKKRGKGNKSRKKH